MVLFWGLDLIHSIVQADLEFTRWPKLASNSVIFQLQLYEQWDYKCEPSYMAICWQ